MQTATGGLVLSLRGSTVSLSERVAKAILAVCLTDKVVSENQR